MVERQFPNILNEMLNCYHQLHQSDQNESRSTITKNEEPNYNLRRRINNTAQMLPPPGPRITQPHMRGRSHHGKKSSQIIPEITFNHDKNTHFRNQTYQTTQDSGHAYHTMTSRTTGTSCDHQGFHSMRLFQSNSLFNRNFPGEYHNNYPCNPTITLNGPEHLDLIKQDMWSMISVC